MSDAHLSTNVFKIQNPDELLIEFSRFRVQGLDREHEDFHRNRSILEYSLRRDARASASVIVDGDDVIASVANNQSNVPSRVDLVRASAFLTPIPGQRSLDFGSPSQEDVPLCLNILHHQFQSALKSRAKFWQPSSGQPVFFKEPLDRNRDLNLFRGLSIRPCELDSGFGIIVDLKHRYVRRKPLPGNLSRDEFKRWKGRKFIYHFGENWYEVRLASHLGMGIGDVMIDGSSESLLQYIVRQARKPVSYEVANLSPSDAAVAYFTGANAQRTVPASLCYATETSDFPATKRFEELVKLSPGRRSSEITKIVRGHLLETTRDGMTIRVAEEPLSLERKAFPVPDLAFGGDTILSTNRRKNVVYAKLPNLGQAKRELLADREIGFLDQEPLGPQILVLPRSVADSYGSEFQLELARAVDEIFPQEHAYDPQVVEYDDRGCVTAASMGSRVLGAIDDAAVDEGHALIVAPSGGQNSFGNEDELASLLVRELSESGIVAAVSHTRVPNECFVENRNQNEQLRYVVRRDKRGKWKGYIRGLALNKVLLNNERWPFAFAKHLNADVTIGIDVKNNTAGFVLLGSNARIIRMQCSTSRRSERLSEDQLENELAKLIAAEASHLEKEVQSVLISRDGRLFDEEIRGIHRAMKRLNAEGVTDSIVIPTLTEVRKSSPSSLRLFDVFKLDDGKTRTRNPRIGDYHIFRDDGFVVTTGWPFRRMGSVRPLHVRHCGGPMPMEQVLQDVFWRSCLTFTKPDDCSTVPIELRLLDRRLRDEAGEYDDDQLKYELDSVSKASL